MKHKKRTYNIKGIAAAILMVIALLWLTVSLPFVYAAQALQEASANHADHNLPDEEESSCNPFGNMTEEKTESNSSSISEYLHHIDELAQLAGSLYKHNCSHSFSVYVAFHGELLSPPPDSILS